MSKILDRIYPILPNFAQNSMVSVFNYLAYNARYSKLYKHYRTIYRQNENCSYDKLIQIQARKFENFIVYVLKNSNYYKLLYAEIEKPFLIENIEKLPIIDKESLRQNLSSIYTIDKKKGSTSKTGGTTGKSLEVIYDLKDIQERFAILDNFRNAHGYELGKKTAWFSGKNLLTTKDIRKNRFWKTDYLYKVRYYSTFHIHNKYLEHYLKDLISYKPEFMVGFPSTMYEIAKYGMLHAIEFPANTIQAIFPTAETVTDDIRNVLESYFKTNLFNQYASSEGAPFILECKNKKLHLELQSGVFEVLDEFDEPSKEGRLVVTSFNSHGTPLIRYDIGDQIKLSDEPKCTCGNNNPIVSEILGRVSDFIYSEETGKVNLGNVSNCLKGVKGIVKFQVQQDVISEIHVLIEKDHNLYTSGDEAIFVKNLRDRLGNALKINLKYVDRIPVEKSGKFRMVKNSLKLNI